MKASYILGTTGTKIKPGSSSISVPNISHKKNFRNIYHNKVSGVPKTPPA